MKKYVNGKYLKMTKEEIAELKSLSQNEKSIPTVIERVEAIESLLLEVIING